MKYEQLQKEDAHDVLGAAERGPDRFYFGSVAEIKTSVGVPGAWAIIEAMKQAERYLPGQSAVVHMFDMLNGVKYFIQLQY
jgi:hypothetical protein